MKTALRIFITFFAFIACYYFIYLMSFALNRNVSESSILRILFSLLIASGVAIFVWKKSGFQSLGLESSILLGGFIVGTFGFIAGFLGPIIFHIGGNQGRWLESLLPVL
jgi:uncharacterized membrane protein YjjB (DUF3815 family)